LGQQQTSMLFEIDVRSALNIGSQLLTVDTSAMGQKLTSAWIRYLSAQRKR
jgi:hypothetical protein